MQMQILQNGRIMMTGRTRWFMASRAKIWIVRGQGDRRVPLQRDVGGAIDLILAKPSEHARTTHARRPACHGRLPSSNSRASGRSWNIEPLPLGNKARNTRSHDRSECGLDRLSEIQRSEDPDMLALIGPHIECYPRPTRTGGASDIPRVETIMLLLIVLASIVRRS